MKIFVLGKDTMIMYALTALLIVGIIGFGTMTKILSTSGDMKEQLPVYNVERADKKIALTFDAAWGADDTEELISIMGEYNIKCSFFVVGGWADKYPQAVKAFAAKGHEILNHSDGHRHMNDMHPEEIKTALLTCESKIKALTGSSPMLFRTPYGEYNNQVIKASAQAGFMTVQWDVDSLDWKDLSPQDIQKRVLKKVKSGSICLFHNGAKNTPAALRLIIPELKKQGYEMVKVSEILYKNNYRIDHAGKQISN